NYTKASNVQLNVKIYNEARDVVFSNVNTWASDKIENFSLEGLAAGDYYVEIVANQNLDVFSKYTLTINAPKVEPSAPTNFKATENVSDVTSKITKNETTLAWDAVENATYYEIRYTTDAANPTWSEIEKVDGLSQAVSLAYATSYKYQVRAVTVYNDNLSGDPAVEGAWTDLEFATVDAPVAPTQLTVSKLDPETHTVKLTWKDVVDENEYQVYLLNADDEVVAESDLAANQTSWTPNYQFDLGGSYCFEIRAKNNAGNGDFAALDFTVEDVPAQPTDLTATVDAAFNATLTWTDVATTETGYEVAILDENNEWKVVATLAAGATEWTTDAPLDPAATHALAVRAVNEYGVSAWTTVELATIEAASTVVTTEDDVVDAYDGEISLREAIQYAEAGATIAFADDVETITLAGTELTIDKALTIQGFVDETGAPQITIDANEQSGVFTVAEGTSAAFYGLTITGGYTDWNGGGVYVQGFAATTFTNVKITKNTAVTGGGVHAENGASVIFTNVEITENVADFNGGGAAICASASAIFTNVEISGNVANQGGGVFVQGGKATLTNVAITENQGSQGVGLSVQGGEATLTNATLVRNLQILGGNSVFLMASTATFNNSIIDGNASVFGATANAYNTLSSFTAWANANEEGVTNYVYDATQPLFNDAENGDFTLAAGSQAINKGNDAYLADEITTDLAGNPRFNGAVDLGAYESQALLAPTNLTVSKLDPETRKVTFAWDDVDLETEYVVLLFTVDGQVQTVLPAGATSWTPDVEFALGSSGFISITPANNEGVGAPAVLTFTVEDVPAAPTNFKTNGDEAAWNKTTLSWDDVETETGYELQVSTDGGATWTEVGTLEADVTTFEAALEYGAAYQYQLRAVNEYGVSEWVSVEFDTIDAPVAPTTIEVSKLDPETRKVTFTWADVADETEYVVLLFTVDGEVQTVLPANTTSWTPDVEFALGSSGFISIAPANNAGVATVPAILNFTVEDVPAEPKLEATVNASTAPTVTLNWTNVEGETGYRVEVQAEDETGTYVWTTLAELDADVDNYATDVQMGQTYYYRVVAVNE
ncbi:MAG: hypothetical protein IIY07_05975, partial [Thermoguttaceae bacterium]|nr:hypothetical protein [Thermoguttaceae bacterium]